jgi:hypothetical protein
VAKAGSSTSTTASSANKSAKASPLAYSQCMRAHGLADFPDPNSQGQIALSAGPGSYRSRANPVPRSGAQLRQMHASPWPQRLP